MVGTSSSHFGQMLLGVIVLLDLGLLTTALEHNRSIDCSKTRLVYVDLGVNWANTLRLYKDLGTCADATHWEVYGFEANPLIQNYANHFTEFLNGQVPMPPKEVPPTGSSEDLHLFAKKYNCSMHKAISRAFKNCMWTALETQLMNVHPNPRLKDPVLLSARLDMARVSNVGSRFPRHVLVPAAAGGASKTITISTNRIGLVRGGSIEVTKWSPSPDQQQVHPAWREMLLSVTQVNVAAWLTSHFNTDDYVVVKADIEGAEHALFRKLIVDHKSCVIDYLAWQCHDGVTTTATFGRATNCAQTTRLIKNNCPSTTITEENKGPYTGIDKATKDELAGLV